MAKYGVRNFAKTPMNNAQKWLSSIPNIAFTLLLSRIMLAVADAWSDLFVTIEYLHVDDPILMFFLPWTLGLLMAIFVPMSVKMYIGDIFTLEQLFGIYLGAGVLLLIGHDEPWPIRLVDSRAAAAAAAAKPP